MAGITRRTALAALGTGISFALPTSRLIAQTTRVRSSVTSAQGKVMVRKFAEAVRRMNSAAIAEGSPKSWHFQWYIHATPVPRVAELNRIYGAGASPGRDLAEKVWSTCQDHFRGADPNMFLPWHRMYLLAFEAVVRSVLGDDDFAMPYWDYTASPHPVLPLEFRSPSSPGFKSLYRPNRNKEVADINAGDPLDKGTTVSPYDLSILGEKTYSDFCNQLNGGLHSAVHVDVGDPSNMGAVPTAAGDPIFWLHHCNIDRLWAAWNPTGGQDPGSGTAFFFAAPDGSVTSFDSLAVGKTDAVGYRYDQLPSRPPVPVSGATAGGPRRVIAASPGPIRLGGQETRVPLQAAPVDGMISGSVASLAGAGRMFLVIRDVRSDIPPGTLFEVFADLPPNAGPDQKRAHYLGTFSFFRATGEHMHGTDNSLSFDVTATVRRLLGANQMSANPTLSIIPVGRVQPNASPVVGELQLVRQ